MLATMYQKKNKVHGSKIFTVGLFGHISVRFIALQLTRERESDHWKFVLSQLTDKITLP